MFQRLEGEATTEGLWLTSAVNDGACDRFRVVAAVVDDLSNLYIGGWFSVVGDVLANNIARAYPLPLPTLSVRRSGPEVMVSWPASDAAGFALEQAGTLAAPASWVTNAASVTDDGTNNSVSLPAANPAQFFRLRRP